MIYFIVTSSVYNDCPKRKEKYINGINQLKKVVKDLQLDSYKILIIENNGKRDTYLDSLDCEVFYTTNNSMDTKNIGLKELQDILDCIQHYSIQDDDFIVKMTGRYLLNDTSEFMNVIKHLGETGYKGVIRYGAYNKSVSNKTDDCITGLIGLSCYYVKQIEKPKENEAVEWKWAAVTSLIEENKVCKVKKLDINICPSGNTFFLV